FGCAGRRHQLAVTVAVGEVFDDRAGLGHGQLAVGDHWRLAQRMHAPEFRRRQHGLRVALVALDLVRHAKFFQQPQDALRARIVEVVESDHSVVPERGAGVRAERNSHRIGKLCRRLMIQPNRTPKAIAMIPLNTRIASMKPRMPLANCAGASAGNARACCIDPMNHHCNTRPSNWYAMAKAISPMNSRRAHSRRSSSPMAAARVITDTSRNPRKNQITWSNIQPIDAGMFGGRG